MSIKAANKLIGRVKRTKLGGKGLASVISDTMKAWFCDGEITTKEMEAVTRAIRQQQRKFSGQLKAQEKHLREQIRQGPGDKYESRRNQPRRMQDNVARART